jgi:hypothetical protein
LLELGSAEEASLDTGVTGSQDGSMECHPSIASGSNNLPPPVIDFRLQNGIISL